MSVLGHGPWWSGPQSIDRLPSLNLDLSLHYGSTWWSWGCIGSCLLSPAPRAGCGWRLQLRLVRASKGYWGTRALTPSQSKGCSTFSQIPEAESSPTWRAGMVVRTLHSSHFSIVQAHLSFLYEKGQYYKKKKRFRSPVPSQGHHAATSHHIKQYFNSQVAPFFE